MRTCLNTFLFMVVMVLVALTSCSRKVTEAVVSNVSRLDSVVYVETARVDTFYTPAETIIELVELECDEEGNVREVADAFRKGRASVVVRVRDNVLTVEANCDSLTKLIVSKDILIDRLAERSEDYSYTKETKVTILIPWFYKMAAWIAATYLFLTLLYIIWKVFRVYLKAQFPFIP